MTLSLLLPVASILIALTALYFTFKKDAHRLRIRKKTVPDAWLDVLSINNDSSFSVQVSAIGCLTEGGSIHWIKRVGDYKANKHIGYPISVPGRSTFHAHVFHRDLPARDLACGYCVQLDCGRTFVTVTALSFKAATPFRLKSMISWLSSGKMGFPRNELHLRHD